MMYREHRPRLAVSPWRARLRAVARACGWTAAACFAASVVALVVSPASLAVPLCWGGAICTLMDYNARTGCAYPVPRFRDEGVGHE